MKRILILFAVMFFLAGCASTGPFHPPTGGHGGDGNGSAVVPGGADSPPDNPPDNPPDDGCTDDGGKGGHHDKKGGKHEKDNGKHRGYHHGRGNGHTSHGNGHGNGHGTDCTP